VAFWSPKELSKILAPLVHHVFATIGFAALRLE